MQRISYDVDVSGEDPLLVASAKIMLGEYIPNNNRPIKVYIAPHTPPLIPSNNGS